MYVVHIALGGCLTCPPVRYGITEDTGGHIAYLLGAALAQAALPEVQRIDLVTRAFDEPSLSPTHTLSSEPIDEVIRIQRIAGGGSAYLEKEALEAALPDLTESFLQLLASGPRPDVLHAHFADAAELALAARARFGIPVVYTPHSLALGKRDCGIDSPQLDRRIARERRAIAEADAIIVSSRDEAERQLCDYGVEASGRTHRISPAAYCASDDGGTNAAKQLLAPFLRRPELPLILAIARPVAKKNLQLLVEAFAKTEGLREVANLAIVAGFRDGPEHGGPEQQRVIRGLLDAVDVHDLYGHVALPKRHEPHAIPQLYRLAAESGGVFVNPALHEPFGLTLLEAAQFGLPVVATNCGGPRDIITNLQHGTLVDPRDAVALGAAVHNIISDKESRARFVAQTQLGPGDYSWTSYAQESARVYGQLSKQVTPTHSQRPGEASRLLISDMDGTLTGSHAGIRQLKGVLRSTRIPFVISTGRSLPEARRIMARWRLPQPDAYVTAVGTEIHIPDGRGRAHLDEQYAEMIGKRWDYDLVRDLLHANDVTFQRDVEQRRWKFGLLGNAAEAQRVRRFAQAAGVAINVTHSHDKLIDVTAPGVDKASAMTWVAKRWKLSAADCIACGDSGNDAAMLRAAGTAVVVANASAELDSLTASHVLRTRAPHAEGICEALRQLTERIDATQAVAA